MKSRTCLKKGPRQKYSMNTWEAGGLLLAFNVKTLSFLRGMRHFIILSERNALSIYNLNLLKLPFNIFLYTYGLGTCSIAESHGSNTNLRGSGTVLVRVTIAVMKHHDLKQAGRTRFISLKLLHCSPSLKDVRAGTHAGQESGDRS